MYDVILRGGVIVNQNGRMCSDLAISGGRIAAMGQLDPGLADQVVDCSGFHILPGVMDTHVHFRDPGGTHKEDLQSGSRAAVMGGVTVIFDMPNTNPQTTTKEALADKVERAQSLSYCDFAFFLGASLDNLSALPELETLPGCCGIKVFMGSSTGNMLVDGDTELRTILANTRRTLAFHCEDEPLLRSRIGFRVPGQPHTHGVWRSPEAALICTRRLLSFAHSLQRRVHILHISTAEELALCPEYRAVSSMEVTPHHLTLCAEEMYEQWGNFAQVNPPLRSRRHQEALWNAVRSGLIDVLGSDHAPHTLEEKRKSYPDSPSGMPGVQTMVPVMLQHVHDGHLTLERFVDLASAGPARVYGMSCKGRIAEGYDADLTIVDLNLRQTVTRERMLSKCGWSPFEGRELTGWPVGTYIRGERVMWEGKICGEPKGKPVSFLS